MGSSDVRARRSVECERKLSLQAACLEVAQINSFNSARARQLPQIQNKVLRLFTTEDDADVVEGLAGFVVNDFHASSPPCWVTRTELQGGTQDPFHCSQ